MWVVNQEFLPCERGDAFPLRVGPALGVDAEADEGPRELFLPGDSGNTARFFFTRRQPKTATAKKASDVVKI